MWSGSNSDQQWGMNRMAFMNMPHEQVDWASLAQQWIKMKEEAPPTEKEEGGEAPMEITKEETTAPTSREHEWMASHAADASAASWGGGGWSWDQAGAWMQWAGATPAGAAPDMAAAAASYSTGPGYTTVPQEHQPPVVPPAPVFPYNPPAPPTAAVDSSYTRGYWTSNPPTENVKNHHSWESSSSSRKKHAAAPVPQPDPAPELDAAKRRALPAWIREGLEKMEREKQKKAEQERMQKLKKEGALDHLSPLNEAGGDPSGVNGDMMEALKKSKFDSDSEEDEVSPPSKAVVESVPTPRRSRFDQSDPVSAPQLLPKPKFRSKEQILQAVMSDVRKILTQILMEVTTEEIEKAVEETHKQFKKKAPAATLRKTPALASLTGKLGLGIYESDSGSESEPEKVTNEPDSDQELRDRIDKLKNEFVRVEEDIEREAMELEEKGRIQLTRIGQLSPVAEDSSPSGVEDQVQPSREGSAASKSEKQILQRTTSEEARSNNGLEDNTRDSRLKDRRSSERKDRRSSERKERRSSERKDRRSSERKDRRSSERKDRRSSERKDRRSLDRRERRSLELKDRRSSERSKSDKRSDSTRSSSSESSSSSSSEESSSPSPRRDKKHKRHHHHHHHHRKDRKSRYSRSSSRSKSRSRSRSRDRYSKRSKHSSSRSSHRKRSDDRKRRHSSSSSSSGSTKYRKTSRRR